MPIDKINEFAKNGQKSTDGIILENGFPQEQKPLRQWFNYLFNKQAVKTNEVIDEINRLDGDVIDLSATKFDTGIEVTPKFPDAVSRTQASKNKEVVSLLDFGAPYSSDSTTHLQSALNSLDIQGGGVLYIPYHTGTLVISGIVNLRPNVTVICDKNLIVDCRGLTSGIQFRAYGTTGLEIPLSANKTSGDNTISTTTAHGLVVGDDVLLISQRECAHADAGELWRLGETTAGVSSPFFAEPVSVKSVSTSTTFNLTAPIKFPDYRTDKTLETSNFARDSSTIMKINAFKKFNWYGGTFKKNSGSLFRVLWGKDCNIEANFERGYGTGQEVYILNSINCKTKSNVVRPTDWILESDHSGYNSIKDVSSWYTHVDLYEENGCQGLDQTFTNYCGIGGVYKVVHINSREDGMTTHGCTYGCDIDVYAVGANYTALRNRARFANIKVRAYGCTAGMRNSTYGNMDCYFDVDLHDCLNQGVVLLGSGVTATSPAFKNSVITGRIYMASTSTGNAIVVDENLEETKIYADSGILCKDLKIRSYSERAMYFGKNVHGVVLSNVAIEHYGTASPIWFRQSAGHTVSNLYVNMVNGDGVTEAIFASIVSGGTAAYTAYGSPCYKIDYSTCKVTNGTLITNDDRLVSNNYTLSGTSTVIASLTLTNANTSNLVKVTITGGSSNSQNRIVLDPKLSIGREFTVLVTATNSSTTSFGVYVITPNTLTFLDGVNDGGGSFLNISGTRQFRVRKISATEFVVSR